MSQSQKVDATYAMSDDDWDELASGSESDDDVKPGNAATKQLKGQLKEPRFKTVNLRQLNDLVQMGNVELNPSYQRDVVWTEPKMIQLVQSLFLNYYVPPVIFAVSWSDGFNDEVRVCIDGKQRCTSIMRFIEGRIPFVSPHTKQKFWYTKFASGQKGGQPLPPVLKRKFDNISIQVVEYDDLTMDQQRDIFQRVQLGMALSAAEKIQALGGPWSEWLTELQKKYITGPQTIGDLLPKFDVARGRPFQVLCSFVMIALSDTQATPTSATQAAFLNRTDPPEPEFRRKVETTLAIFIAICTDHYAEAFALPDKRVAPIEFWFISLLIFSRMRCMSVSRLARTISEMRTDVRDRHVDIRSNSKVAADFFKFIDTVPRTKQPGEIVASEEFDSTSRKRTREEEADESYRGGVTGIYRDDDPTLAATTRSKKAKVKESPAASPAVPRMAPPPSCAEQPQNEAWAQQIAASQYLAHVPAVPPPIMAMDNPYPPQQQATYIPQPPQQPTYPKQTVRNMCNASFHHNQ